MKKNLLLILLISSINTFACSCIKRSESLKSNINREFKSSIAIFKGKVINKKIYRVNEKFLSSGDIIAYTFLISKIYKGEIFKKEIVIKSNRGSESCGYIFKLNKNYLVYSNFYGIDTENTNKNDLFTSICHRTDLLKNVKRKELRLLKKLHKKRKKNL